MNRLCAAEQQQRSTTALLSPPPMQHDHLATTTPQNTVPTPQQSYLHTLSNIPALQGLQSEVDDYPAQNINAGDPLNDNHVVAARNQHKNRKALEMANLATDDEVTESKRRKHGVESANFDGSVPLWAQQMMQQNQQMQQQMQQQLQRMERRIEQESQRSMNRSRRSTSDAIEQLVRLADGYYPHQHQVWFPADQESLLTATVPNLTALLLFYNIPVNGNRQQKIASLKKFLGVTL